MKHKICDIHALSRTIPKEVIVTITYEEDVPPTELRLPRADARKLAELILVVLKESEIAEQL